MKTNTFVAALGACALVLTATATHASVLNKVELRRLVASGGPADHARLVSHFDALAAKAEGEAAREQSFARGLIGNPNRTWAIAPGAAAARRAEAARRTAHIIRDLARYHERVAAGEAAALPAQASRFHGGEGASEPTAGELRVLAAEARTPADHRDLEEYFVTLAAKHRAGIAQHVAMARGLRANAGRRTGSGDPAVHCDVAVKTARGAEREALGRALIHRELAAVAVPF